MIAHDHTAGYGTSCTWACHAAKHITDLGDDRAPLAVGTLILAPFSGTLRNYVRSESPVLYIAQLQSTENPSIIYETMHLSRFQTPGYVPIDGVIGWTGGARGAVGSGQADGPHLHENLIVNGKLTPIAELYSQYASVGPVTPALPPEENMSFSLVPIANSTVAGEVDIVSLITGKRVMVQSSYHLGLLSRLKANNYNDPMLGPEIDICMGYLQTINPVPVVAPPVIPPISISPDSIEAGVKAALATAELSSTGKVTFP